MIALMADRVRRERDLQVQRFRENLGITICTCSAIDPKICAHCIKRLREGEWDL